MPSTTKGFPYPANSDPVNIPGDIQSLASAIDTYLPASFADVTTSSTQTLANKTLTSPEETASVTATVATGTVNVDISTAAVNYYTANSSANWTFNFRGNSGTTLSSILPVNIAVSVVIFVTNGATAFRPTAFTIDGVSVTPRWQGGSAPASGNANSIDAYSFTILKTAATPTYIVFASQTRFA